MFFNKQEINIMFIKLFYWKQLMFSMINYAENTFILLKKQEGPEYLPVRSRVFCSPGRWSEDET